MNDVIDPAPACASCGTALRGPYCHACGQPGRDAARSLREVLLGQTGRMVHTVRALLMRPGELAREIDEGRDRQSLRPLTLLLNLIAVFFLIGAPGNFTFATIVKQDRTGRIVARVEERAARDGVPRELVIERFDRRFQSLYSLLIPFSAVVYGAALWLLHRSRRKAWLVHVAGAVHYLCFVFVLAAVLFLAGRVLHFGALQNPLTLGADIAASFVYLVLMQHRTYEDAWPAAIAKSAAVLVAGAASDYAVFTAAMLLTMAV